MRPLEFSLDHSGNVASMRPLLFSSGNRPIDHEEACRCRCFNEAAAFQQRKCRPCPGSR